MSVRLKVVPVDERSSRWEDQHARYRVYFFGAPADNSHGPVEPMGGRTTTVDVTGGEYSDVLEYAEAHTHPSMLFAIALVLDDPESGTGLVWLTGMDYHNSVDDSWDAIRRQRMEDRARKSPHRAAPPT